MTESPLRARADELALDADLVDAWEGEVSPQLVEALLANLIRFEDALQELAR